MISSQIGPVYPYAYMVVEGGKYRDDEPITPFLA